MIKANSLNLLNLVKALLDQGFSVAQVKEALNDIEEELQRVREESKLWVGNSSCPICKFNCADDPSSYTRCAFTGSTFMANHGECSGYSSK